MNFLTFVGEKLAAWPLSGYIGRPAASISAESKPPSLSPPELHQTDNLNPVTRPIYNWLTRLGGIYGPKPGVASSAPASGPYTSTARGSYTGEHTGFGHTAAQSRNNALYRQPDGPGFQQGYIAGETVKSPGSIVSPVEEFGRNLVGQRSPLETVPFRKLDMHGTPLLEKSNEFLTFAGKKAAELP